MLNSYREFLSSVDINDLLRKIDGFRMLDFKILAYNQIREEILKVLSVKINGEQFSSLLRTFGTYPSGTQFYRVRTLAPDDHYIPLKAIQTAKDVWNPPNHIVRNGRLNKEKESVLYTSPGNFKIAIQEGRIQDHENFVLIVFESIEEIRVCNMTSSETLMELDELENAKHKIINDFLIHEFIRDVSAETSYLYQISECIVKEYFDLPAEFQDAWCYPSIAMKGSYNVCFREDKAKKKLVLKGIIIATKESHSGSMYVKPKAIGLVDSETSPFQYYELGSEQQKRVFPEIIATDSKFS